MAEAFELSNEMCERLLHAGVAGRIALSTPNGPHIIPVNYSVVDQAVLVRTAPYSLLGTYGRDTTLAFEIDHLDHAAHRGWSVVARGRGEIVTDPDELDHIQEVWPPRPWASGGRNLYLRLRWTELTGRRLGEGWDPAHDLAVHRVV